MRNNLLFVLSSMLSLWFLSCTNKPQDEQSATKSIVAIDHDSLIVDSLLKHFDSTSILFLNYPHLISENDYFRIKKHNIKSGILDPNSFYNGYFEGNLIQFRVEPNFVNNKLVSVLLTYESHPSNPVDHLEDPLKSLEDRLRSLEDFSYIENIVSAYSLKYGNPIKSTRSTKFNQNSPYRLIEEKSQCKQITYYTYKFSKKNMNILLEVDRYEYEGKIEYEKDEVYSFSRCHIRIGYSTKESDNYRNKVRKLKEDAKNKSIKKKNEKTLKEI